MLTQQNEEGKIDKEGSYAELALMKAAVNSEYYDLFEKAAIQCLEKRKNISFHKPKVQIIIDNFTKTLLQIL